MVTAPHAPVPFSPALEDLYIPSPGQDRGRRRARSWGRRTDGGDPDHRHAQMGPGDAGGHARRLARRRGRRRSRRARRSPTSRPRRSPTSSRARSTGLLRRRLVGDGETVPVGALLGVVADASVAGRRRSTPSSRSSRRTSPPRAAEARRSGPGARDRRGRRPPAPLPRARRCRRHAGHLHPWLRRRPQQLAVQPAAAGRAAHDLRHRPAGPWRLDQGGGRRRRRRADRGRLRLHGGQGHRARASGRPFAGRGGLPRPGAQPSRARGLGRPLVCPAGARPRDLDGVHRRLHEHEPGAQAASRSSRCWSPTRRS